MEERREGRVSVREGIEGRRVIELERVDLQDRSSVSIDAHALLREEESEQAHLGSALDDAAAPLPAEAVGPFTAREALGETGEQVEEVVVGILSGLSGGGSCGRERGRGREGGSGCAAWRNERTLSGTHLPRRARRHPRSPRSCRRRRRT